MVFNAAEVTAWGLELEGTVLLTDGLTLNANVGYLDTEYDEFRLDLDLDPSTPETFHWTANDVTRAPEWTCGYSTSPGSSTWATWGDITAIVGAVLRGREHQLLCHRSSK